MDRDLQTALRKAGYLSKFHLGSLIEACGPRQFRLETVRIGARTLWYASEGDVESGCGCESPEEAVAYLWLALHNL